MKRRQFKQQIIEMLKGGHYPWKILEAIPGSCPYQISRIRRNLGMKPFMTGRRRGGGVGPGEKTERFLKIQSKIRRMKCAGMSYAQIGDALYLTKQRVQQYLRIPKPEGRTRCDGCGKKKPKLSCHHKSYEDDSSYEVLCLSCHRKKHRGKIGMKPETQQRQFRILAMRQLGMSYKEIAAKEGLSHKSIHAHLKGHI